MDLCYLLDQVTGAGASHADNLLPVIEALKKLRRTMDEVELICTTAATFYTDADTTR